MKFSGIKWTFQHMLLSTKRIKLYVQPPWGLQCRKFDFYISYYPRPIDTISFGFTIPFIICFYFSLGVKFHWWGKNIAPQLSSASAGVWIFAGSKTSSLGIKFNKKTHFCSIDY